jgi:hypothetical protein
MADLDPVEYRHQPAPHETIQGTVVSILAYTVISEEQR